MKQNKLQDKRLDDIIGKLVKTINERLSLIGKKLCSHCRKVDVISRFRTRMDKRRNPPIVWVSGKCMKCEAIEQAERTKKQRKTPEGREKHNNWARQFQKRHREKVLNYLRDRRKTEEYKNYMREYRKKNKEKIYQQEVITKKRYHEKHRDGLTDEYIIRGLVNDGYGTKEEISKNKDLIEYKRAKILLHRIKLQTHGKTN